MNIQTRHFLAKVCNVVLAIFAPLVYKYFIGLFMLLAILAPRGSFAQDTAAAALDADSMAADSFRLDPNYTPYYRWDLLSDSLYYAYMVWYPEKWKSDSIYYSRQNRLFIDSALYSDAVKGMLFYPRYNDSVVQSASFSESPPPNDDNLHTKPVPTWVFIICLVVIVGLIFLKFSNLRLFRLLFLSFFNIKYCDEALKELDTPVNMYNLAATLLSAMVYGVVIWQLAIKGNLVSIHPNHFVSFLIIFTGISVFYLLRYMAMMLAAAVVEAEYTYDVLVQVTVSGNMWMSMLIIPTVFLTNAALFHYSSPFLPFYLALALLIYLIIKQVRVFFQVAGSFPHSIIYLILYLCALEIAPYLAVFKVIITNQQ